MKFDIRVMAHPKRREHVLTMLNDLGLDESVVAYDDRPNGGSPIYTSRKAWFSPFESDDITHRIVIQDDVEVIDGFKEIADELINNFPNAIFTLYTGQDIQFSDKKKNSPYISMKGCCCYGVALIIPRKIIKDCFSWITENLGEDYKHDDCGIGLFALINGYSVFSTIPNIVQHIAPTNSLMRGHNRASKVSATYVGKDLSAIDIDWNDRNYNVSRYFRNETWLNKNDERNQRILKLINERKRLK